MIKNKYISVLKNKNYMIYLIGQIVSMFSDGLFKISIIWSLVDDTNSVKPIAMMLLISYLPQLFIGIIGGYFIDKYDRKIIMVISDLISGVAILSLFYQSLNNELNLYFILIVRFVLSLMDVFYSPATMAYIPKVVGEEDLLAANSLFAIMREVMGVISFGISGIIVSKLGITSILLLNAVAYFFAAVMIFLIPVEGKVEDAEDLKFNFKELTSGFKIVKKDAFVLQFICLIFLTNISYDIIYNLPSIYAKTVLNSGVEGYGFIQTALSLGMLLGVGIIGLFSLKRSGLLYIIGMFVGGVTLYLLGINESVFFGVILYFIFSLTDALSIPSFTYLQLHVEDSIKGRVFAAFDTIVLFATPISALVINTFFDRLGVTNAYKISGIFLILIGIFALNLKTFRNASLDNIKNKSVE